MNEEEFQDIQDLLKKAVEASKNMPKELREKAFELAFKKMTSLGEKTKRLISDVTENTGSSSDFFARMKVETGIQESQLRSIFRLDNNGRVKVVVPLSGTNAEKQRMLAYLYLYAEKVGFGREWVSALDFAQQTKEYGINDSHVSKNLGHDKINIRQSGRKRGKEYSLTPNGTMKAKNELQNIIVTEQI